MVIDTSDWIGRVKEKIEQGKQDAFVWYSIGARWFTMASLLLYVAACIVAGGMVGPVRYVEFLYHACHWEAAEPHQEQSQATPTMPPSSEPHKPPAAEDIPAKIAPRYKPESSF